MRQGGSEKQKLYESVWELDTETIRKEVANKFFEYAIDLLFVMSLTVCHCLKLACVF